MQEYLAKYSKDGEIVDGGLFTGGYGMKNAKQCARGAIRAGAADAVIIDKAADAVLARFMMGDAGEVVAAEFPEGLTGAAWANADEQDTSNETDDVSDFLTYRAELDDPECADRKEIILANDDAISQALEFCTGDDENEVALLELHLLNDDYDSVREVDLGCSDETETPPEPEQTQSESGVANFFPIWEKVKNDKKGGDDSGKGAADNFLPNGQEVAESGILTISVPFGGFDPAKLENLVKMVTAKESLIRAALGLPNDAALPIRISADNEQLQFPWFPFTTDSATVNAYALFVERLTATAKAKKRVTAKEKGVDGLESPKFTMRAWLLSLGCIGERFKEMRKIWLQNLPGNASFASNDKYLEMQAKRRKPAAGTDMANAAANDNDIE